MSEQERYVIVKSSRLYGGGVGYSGIACERAGVDAGKVYQSKEEALIDAEKMTRVNPVGFRVEVWRDVPEMRNKLRGE